MALYIGYSGMETPLVVLALATLLYALRFPSQHWLGTLAVFALPLTRPDAVSFALLFLIFVARRDIRRALVGLGSLICGVAVLAARETFCVLTGHAQ